jgi:hypothetical protein
VLHHPLPATLACTQALTAKPDQGDNSRNGTGRHEGSDNGDDTEENDQPGSSRSRGSSGANASGGSNRRQGQGQGMGGPKRGFGTTSQRQGLLYGMERSSAAASRRDVEEGPSETVAHETFADRMEYTIRKRLLSRFYWGVSVYLVASIAVVLLVGAWVLWMGEGGSGGGGGGGGGGGQAPDQTSPKQKKSR